MKKSIIDAANLTNLKSHLENDPKMMVIAHANPDGDTLGGAFGVYLGLKSKGYDIEIACFDPVPEKYQFLAQSEDLVTDFDENDYDTYIFVDAGHPKMIKFGETKPRIMGDDFTQINIDHHASNTHYGDINFVPLDVCSSTEVVYRILQELDVTITPSIATSLMLGVYTDTGSFMHQNTTASSYGIGAELLRFGADVPLIADRVFRCYEFKTLKLWSKVLENLELTEEGAAIVGVSREDYESVGASRSDLEGVIDFINSIPEAKYSVMLSEDEKGNVKSSLRTRKEDVDVKALAEKFGGGGHVKAAGFTIPHGKLKKEVRWRIVTDEEGKS